MKKIITITLLLVAGFAMAKGGSHAGNGHASGSHVNSSSHTVKGYTKKNGTYVEPHRATNPNGTKTDK